MEYCVKVYYVTYDNIKTQVFEAKGISEFLLGTVIQQYGNASFYLDIVGYKIIKKEGEDV